MSISFVVLLTSRHNPILHKNEPILPESKHHGQIYVTVDGSGTGHEAHGTPSPLLGTFFLSWHSSSFYMCSRTGIYEITKFWSWVTAQ